MSQKIRSRPHDGSRVSDQTRPPLCEFVSIVILPCEAPPFVLWLVYPLNRNAGAISASDAVRRVITTVLFGTLTPRCDTGHSKGTLLLRIRTDTASLRCGPDRKATGKRLWRNNDRQEVAICGRRAVVCYTLLQAGTTPNPLRCGHSNITAPLGVGRYCAGSLFNGNGAPAAPVRRPACSGDRFESSRDSQSLTASCSPFPSIPRRARRVRIG